MPLVTNVTEMNPFQLGSVYDRSKPVYAPLYSLLFPASTVRELMGDTITLQQTEKGFSMASMSTNKKRARTTGRDRTDTERTVRAPYLDESKELSENNFYLNRVVGQAVFVDSGDEDRYTARVKEQLMRDVEFLKNMITLRKEWLTAQMLTGITTYTNAEDGSSFELDYEKPVGNTVTLPAGRSWDTTTGVAKPMLDMQAVDKLAVEHGILPPDFVILGKNAADAFNLYLHDGDDNVIKSQVRVSVRGVMSELGNILQANGLMYLGTMGHKEFWGDFRTYTDDAGAPANYIRADYVELFNAGDMVRTAAEFRAPIRDIIFDAFGNQAISNPVVPSGLTPANNAAYIRMYSDSDPSSLKIVASERPVLWQEDGRKMFSLKVTNV